MNELEIAKALRRIIQGGVQPQTILTSTESWEVLIACRARVAELEAAEKEASEPSTVTQTARDIRYLKEGLRLTNANIAQLTLRFDRPDRLLGEIVRRFNNHFHDTFSECGGGTTGKARERSIRNTTECEKCKDAVKAKS